MGWQPSVRSVSASALHHLRKVVRLTPAAAANSYLYIAFMMILSLFVSTVDSQRSTVDWVRGFVFGIRGRRLGGGLQGCWDSEVGAVGRVGLADWIVRVGAGLRWRVGFYGVVRSGIA